jgi:membrane peptidoglycan carboxypeptidase
MRYYPFVLGAQPVRPIDLAAFYAAISNEGERPTPHAIESIEQDGKVIYRAPQSSLTRIASADGVAFFQLKTMMQGVLQRGTAARIASLAPYVAGTTGTTDGENDAWFVGFTNEVTVAVWVGDDNADGRRRTLGGGTTGGSVAVPIFEPIIQAVWANHAPRTLLRGPSPETRRHLVAQRISLRSGDPVGRDGRVDGERDRQGLLVEYQRRDDQGRVVDTQYRLVSRAETYDGFGRYERPDESVFPPWRSPQAGGGFFGGGGGFFGNGGFNGPSAPPGRGDWGKPLWGRDD